MLEGLGCRRPCYLLPVPGAERPAGSGEVNLLDRVASRCKQTLEDGGVLGVNREDFALVAPERFDYDGTCRHKGFLVGEGDCLAGFQGGERRPEAAEAHHRAYNYVHAALAHEIAQAGDASPNLAAAALESLGDLGIAPLVADDDIGGVEFAGLGDEGVHAAARRDEFDLKEVAMLPDDIQGLGPYGSC